MSESESLHPGLTGNYLLDRLAVADAGALLADAERATMRQGEDVFRRDEPLEHVYFPISGMCSVVVELKHGQRVEAATIGREGMAGLAAGQGLTVTHDIATVQIPGDWIRVPAESLRRAQHPGGGLDRLLRHYAAYRLRSAHQIIACNLMHSLEQRMCRWLLMAHDRSPDGDAVPLTHEFLSEMLGARRPTVTVIAGALQAAGFIAYRRGTLRVLDRPGLEAASCECYAEIRGAYTAIMESPHESNGAAPAVSFTG